MLILFWYYQGILAHSQGTAFLCATFRFGGTGLNSSGAPNFDSIIREDYRVTGQT